MIGKILKYLLGVVTLNLIFIRPAKTAYIDPNTGGMLFQMLAVIFGVLSGLVLIFSSLIKKGYYRILRFLRSLKPGRDIDVSR